MRPADYFLLGSTGGATPAGPLGRLTTRRTNFIDADSGAIVKYRGCTGFTLLQDFLAGTDRTAFVRWARSKGATHIRGFGMWGKNDPLGIFDPRQYGDRFYRGAVDCASWLLSEGLYQHFVCATDQVPDSGIMFNRAALIGHHMRCMEGLAPIPGMFFEDINEFDFNGKVVFPEATPTGLLRTRSSWVDGNWPTSVGSVLAYTNEHTPRDDEWARKAKNLLETCRLGMGEPPNYFPPTNKAAIGAEPKRMQDATPREYADYTASGELCGAGTCLHGDPATLQRCDIPSDESVPNAVATVRADPPPADLVEVGNYTRGGLPTCPIAHSDDLALRTFAMIAGSRATAVVVSPRPGWSLRPVNGWRVARVYGFEGNTIDLVR
jgi:hypothetical protein